VSANASPADETDESHRILVWAFLVALAGVRGVGGGLLWSSGSESVAFELLTWYGFNWFAWEWLVAETRAHRATLPLDTGALALVVWTPVAVAVLWRHQRWRGVRKAAIVFGLWAATIPLAIAVRAVVATVVALSGPV
jgi:hypothetical protein